jgi:protein TonB
VSAQDRTYGAEELDAKYPLYALFSLGISLFLIFGAAFFPLIREMLREPLPEQIHVKATRVINYSQLQAPPPIDLERRIPEPLEAVPKAKTIKYLQPVAKKDEEVPDDEHVPTIDELSHTMIGTENVEGTDSVFFDQPDVQVVSEPVPEKKPEEAFSFVEVMPSFPGGSGALAKYLAENTSYPSFAREAEIQGKVFISFVVEADGSISNVEVVRNLHPVLDEEAARVVASMPNWIPGEQNQQPVRVRYTLPITFQIRY